MAASLLTSDELRLDNIPLVNDIFTTRRLLRELGATVEFLEGDHSVRLRAEKILSHEAPYDLVKTMRASVLVLGPLLARTGRARVSMPGGCAIGARPINLHIKGLEKLGATVKTEHGYVEAAAERLRGTEILFDKISVTGTENLMMAAALAEGETILQNAACEPEVIDLAQMLTDMGAKIQGAGTPAIRIQGVAELHGTSHRIIPDRIEAGTFLIAGAITGGALDIVDVNPKHLASILEKLREAGVHIEVGRRKSPGSWQWQFEIRGRRDEGISGLRDGYAGAVYGAHDANGRYVGNHGKYFRKQVHACERTDAHGSQYPHRRIPGYRERQDASERRNRHCLRSARQRFSGSGGPGC